MASKNRLSSGGQPAPDAVAAALDRFATARLAEVLSRQRWFGSKGRRIVSVSALDAVELGARAPGAWLTLLDVAFERGPREIYSVPLVLRAEGQAAGEVLGRLDTAGAPPLVVDAFADEGFCRVLLGAFEEGLTLRARRGAIQFVRTAAFPRLAPGRAPASRRLRGEQSHTSVVYDDALILKAFRKLEVGINPEHEMTGFLTTRAGFAHVPQLAGAAGYAGADGTAITLAVLHRFTPSQGDGWSWILTHLKRLRDFVATRARHEPLGGDRLVQLVRDASAAVLGAVRRLGALTGGLHTALASDPIDPAFAPEPITADDVARWAQRIAGDLERTLDMLRPRLPGLPAAARRHAQTLLDGAASLRACVGSLDALVAHECCKIRIHGDYHLGQTLRTAEDFVILDFEGEPTRPLAERRAKDCVLRDVAGMLRSFDYAAATALGEGASLAAGDTWCRLASEAFLDGYLGEITPAPVRLVPAARSGLARALAAFELDKALYELRYEIDNRPAWIAVPLAGLNRLRERGLARALTRGPGRPT